MHAVTHVNQLPTPSYDGEGAAVRYGGQETRLRWNEGVGRWIGRPIPVATTLDEWPLVPRADTPGVWVYLSGSLNSQESGNHSYGYQPHPVLDAKAGFDAGLGFQENLTAVWWTFTSGQRYDLGVVWYAFDQDDSIDPSIVVDAASPGRNLGAVLQGPATIRVFGSTTWIDSPIDIPAKSHLMPHLYSNHAVGVANDDGHLNYLLARWRWVYDPTP